MKAMLFVSCSILMGCAFVAIPQRAPASNEEVLTLARVSKNLDGLNAIELVSVHLSGVLGRQEDQLIVRSISASGVKQLNVTRYRMMIDQLLTHHFKADREPIVMKSRDEVCYMAERPTPELAVLRYSEKNQKATMDMILTNQSCAFSSWLAPDSIAAETAAEVLYRFLLDSAIR